MIDLLRRPIFVFVYVCSRCHTHKEWPVRMWRLVMWQIAAWVVCMSAPGPVIVNSFCALILGILTPAIFTMLEGVIWIHRHERDCFPPKRKKYVRKLNFNFAPSSA